MVITNYGTSGQTQIACVFNVKQSTIYFCYLSTKIAIKNLFIYPRALGI